VATQGQKPIRLTNHARARLLERDVSENEVKETIAHSRWQLAEHRRYTCARRFRFEAEHLGKWYNYKDVVPIFVEEVDEIVVITVYSFFS